MTTWAYPKVGDIYTREAWLPIIGPCYLGALATGSELPTLYQLWAAPKPPLVFRWGQPGQYEALVWAPDEATAFHEFASWLDGEGHCDVFRAGVPTAGSGQPGQWARRLTHIQSDCWTKLAGAQRGSELFIPNDSWGMVKVTGPDEIKAAARASMYECWEHNFLPGDRVHFDGDSPDNRGMVRVVSGVSDGDVTAHPEDTTAARGPWISASWDLFTHIDPVADKIGIAAARAQRGRTQPVHTDLQHESDFFFGKGRLKMPPSTHDPVEHKRMTDFFFGKKPPPPRKGGGGFMGLDSFGTRRSRR